MLERRVCCGLKAILLGYLRLALNWRSRDREQPWPNSQLTCRHSFLHSVRYSEDILNAKNVSTVFAQHKLSV